MFFFYLYSFIVFCSIYLEKNVEKVKKNYLSKVTIDTIDDSFNLKSSLIKLSENS